jgi:hypothetical protein
VFSYAVAAKAELDLQIVEALMVARERFRLQLRPAEVLRELHLSGTVAGSEAGANGGAARSVEEIGPALEQLAEWGNVAHFYDSAAPETLAEFYGKRFLTRSRAFPSSPT